VSRAEILERKLVSKEHFDAAADLAMALFKRGSEFCAKRGLILVDTKYEFGLTKEGRIVVIDEIHTPDSSRFWFSKSYEERRSAGQSPESFDKEYLRRWLSDKGFRGDGPIPNIPDEVRVESARRYIEACDAVRGSAFEPNLENPTERLAKNLKARV
jgi:phosphoribosylaminoimidazole-succinocarboxamide synthase